MANGERRREGIAARCPVRIREEARSEGIVNAQGRERRLVWEARGLTAIRARSRGRPTPPGSRNEKTLKAIGDTRAGKSEISESRATINGTLQERYALLLANINSWLKAQKN